MIIYYKKKKKVKYLGVYLDNNLTWKPHIEYLCTRLSGASYLLIKLRHNVDQKTLIAVYNSKLLFIHIYNTP